MTKSEILHHVDAVAYNAFDIHLWKQNHEITNLSPATVKYKGLLNI